MSCTTVFPDQLGKIQTSTEGRTEKKSENTGTDDTSRSEISSDRFPLDLGRLRTWPQTRFLIGRGDASNVDRHYVDFT